LEIKDLKKSSGGSISDSEAMCRMLQFSETAMAKDLRLQVR
jgi:hypothetical protein